MAVLNTRHSLEKELEERYDLCTKWMEKVKCSGDSLLELMDMHKAIWKEGLRHENFGPDKYGMFRTLDIANMKPSEVYLGNVDGIWTNSVQFWEDDKENAFRSQKEEGKPLEKPDHYVRVCKQYRDHLFGNLKFLRNHIYDGGISREILESNISRACNLYLQDRSGVKDRVGKVSITTNSLSENQIVDFRIIIDGTERKASLVNANGKILLPVGHSLLGAAITPRNFKEYQYFDMREALLKNGRIDNVYDFTKQGVKVKLEHGTDNGKDISRSELKRNVEHVKSLERKGVGFGR